jgi:hypothetical protein
MLRCFVTAQPATSSTAEHSTAKWFMIDQIGNKLDGTLQDVSAYHSPSSFNLFLSLSSGRAPYLISLTHSEKAKPICMMFPTQVTQGLPGRERDHGAAPSRHLGGAEVQSLLHTEPRRRLANGHVQPKHPLLRHMAMEISKVLAQLLASCPCHKAFLCAPDPDFGTSKG